MLPITPTDLRIQKKADYAFSFHRQNVHAAELYDRLDSAGLRNNISQTTDAVTGRVALFSGIEVKQENGGKNEALAQLAIWLSAGLENVRRLGEIGHKRKFLGEELRPMVGWTIIGHDWHTYIAYRADKNGRDICNVVGPWRPAAADTRDVYGLFKILRLIKRAEEFASQEYWPWLKDEILEPCASGDN